MWILNGTKSIYLDIFFEPGALIDTNATLVGAGGVCKGFYFHALFPTFITQQAHIIAHLELLAFIVALKAWLHLVSNTKSVACLDNVVAVSAINTGQSRDPFINAGLREIAFLSALHNFEVKVCPGADPGRALGPWGPGPPLITKNEAPAPKFYKIEAPEWQF